MKPSDGEVALNRGPNQALPWRLALLTLTD